MYQPAILFSRTPEERKNQVLSWNRSDKAFFAAGACHILAYTFKWLHVDKHYDVVLIQPKEPFTQGSHVYVTNGEWAFDFNGWTKENELLEETQKEMLKRYTGWIYEKIILGDDLEESC